MDMQEQMEMRKKKLPIGIEKWGEDMQISLQNQIPGIWELL